MSEWVGFGLTTTDTVTGQRIAANVRVVDSTGAIYEYATMVKASGIDDGFARIGVATGPATVTMSATGYSTLTIKREMPGAINANYALTPVSVTVPQPTREERFNVRANFCNVWLDGKPDAPIFSAMLPLYDEQGKFDAVLRDLVAAGSTHVTISPEASYPGQGSFDWRDQPERFAALVRRVSETAGANGKALTPILFMDNGSADPLPRLNRYWPGLAAALAPILDRCIVVPAWEPVKGDYTSYELSQALKLARQLFGGAILGCHFSPWRWVGSSNPVEPDDPWQGGESIFYKDHGGEFIEIAFYQSDADAVFDPNCDPSKEDCWLNRWEDGVVRLGNGVNGWRILPICLSEGPAYSFIRGNSTPTQARAWAKAGGDYATSLGVTVSYMNGLPTESI